MGREKETSNLQCTWLASHNIEWIEWIFIFLISLKSWSSKTFNISSVWGSNDSTKIGSIDLVKGPKVLGFFLLVISQLRNVGGATVCILEEKMWTFLHRVII